MTVRNDYTPQQPPDNSTTNNPGHAWFILTAQLYDNKGIQIDAPFFPPGTHPNYDEVGLDSGEIKSVDIYMATANHDIDHYAIIFGWLGSKPVT